MKYCPSCGSQIPENMKFCPNCGVSLDNNNNQTTANNTTSNSNGPKPKVENKSIATCVILSLVTCGIYGIIWFFSLVTDVNTVCQDDKSDQSAGTVFLLTLVTCGIYGIIWFYNCGKRMHDAGIKYNMQIADNSILYLVLDLFGFGIVNYCLIQSDLNKYSM